MGEEFKNTNFTPHGRRTVLLCSHSLFARARGGEISLLRAFKEDVHHIRYNTSGMSLTFVLRGAYLTMSLAWTASVRSFFGDS